VSPARSADSWAYRRSRSADLATAAVDGPASRADPGRLAQSWALPEPAPEPPRPSARPTATFLARRATRRGLPLAIALTLFENLAAR